jgi:hypothetical protein
MWCDKYNHEVRSEDCAGCITKRRCYQWCLNFFVWGVKDEREPFFIIKRPKNFSKRPVSKYWLSV